MPATRSELIARAELLLPPRRAESAIPGRSDSLEETLLVVLNDELPDLARSDDEVRRLLTRSFPVTLDGSSSIALTDASLADVDPDSLDTAELYIPNISDAASYCRDYASFLAGTPRPGLARWCVAEGRIWVRAASPALTAGKACTLRDCVFVPTVSETNPASNTLPVALEERVVNMVVAAHLAKLAQTFSAPAPAGGQA